MPKNSTYEDVLAYLTLSGGPEALGRFQRALNNEGQRIGQAFMNALTDEDYVRLSGSLYDPFYKDSHVAVNAALDFLLAV